jgi:hypothetical protein
MQYYFLNKDYASIMNKISQSCHAVMSDGKSASLTLENSIGISSSRTLI